VDLVIIGIWLTYPFHWNGLSVTGLGLFALVACIVIGFALTGILQSSFTSRFLGRIGLAKKFFAIVRFVLSLFFIVGFILFGLNLAGLAVPWEQRIPGLNLSLAQILRLVLSVFLVFWLSSVIKGQVVSRFLSRSRLDASLQVRFRIPVGAALPQCDLHLRTGSLVVRRAGSEGRDDNDQGSISVREVFSDRGEAAPQSNGRVEGTASRQ
jgi:hypothetical protein